MTLSVPDPCIVDSREVRTPQTRVLECCVKRTRTGWLRRPTGVTVFVGSVEGNQRIVPGSSLGSFNVCALSGGRAMVLVLAVVEI